MERNHTLTQEVRDTQKINRHEVRKAYAACANWTSNPKRLYGNSRAIYEIFAGGKAGDWFGKEVPAMIAYDFSGRVLFVLPHSVRKQRFSLRSYVSRRMGSYEEDTTITICEFLEALKRTLHKNN